MQIKENSLETAGKPLQNFKFCSILYKKLVVISSGKIRFVYQFGPHLQSGLSISTYSSYRLSNCYYYIAWWFILSS